MKDIRLNYLQLQGWMIQGLNLKGNDLLAFGLIYGFCQEENQEFTGSIDYLCTWLNASRPTVSKSLNDLCEQELLVKKVVIIHGVTFNKYSVNLVNVKAICKNYEEKPAEEKLNLGRGKKQLKGSKESLGVVKNLYGGSKESLWGGSKESLPNNTILNNTNNNFFIIKEGFKIFQKNLKERYLYEEENFIMFLDNSAVFNGKIIIPEIFLLDFLTELHPVRLEGMLRLFDGRIEEKKERFLKITKILFKERSSSTFEDIDHFINTVRKINKDFEYAKKSYTQNPSTQKKITHVAGQENLF